MFRFFYFSFEGRCSRKIYWLVGWLPFFLAGVIVGFVSIALRAPSWFSYVAIVILLGPMLAMQAKRWHDINLSGWFSLLTLVPYVGLLTSIVVGFVPGTPGDNKFGRGPRAQT